MTCPAADSRFERRADAAPGAARVPGELERFFVLSRALLCVADFDGFFRRVNPAFERVLGHSNEELLHQRLKGLGSLQTWRLRSVPIS